MAKVELSIAAVLILFSAGAVVVVRYYPIDPSVDTRKAASAIEPKITATKAAGAMDTCFSSGFEITPKTARQRVAACSLALQAQTLTDAEVALVRLNRGAARMAIGDSVMANVDYKESLKHYDNVIDPAHSDALALYRRATALDALGETKRAVADYNEAIRMNPDEPLAFLGRGVLMATRERDFDRAIADFDKVLKLAPNNVTALIRRGDAYGQLDRFGEALADLDRAVVLAPKSAQARLFRGLANGRRGNTTLALADYDATLELDPNNFPALINRAAIHAGNKQYDLAIRDLDAAIAINVQDPLAFYDRGYAHFAKHEYDLAGTDYTAAIRINPGMGLAYNNRCLVRAIVGKEMPEALADCDMALKLMPTNLDVRETRGFLYLKTDQPRLAIDEYTAALDVDGNRSIALYGRGLAKSREGQVGPGNSDMAAALALNSSVATRFSIYGLN